MSKITLVFSFIGVIALQQWARAEHTPEARTPEEFDLYLDFQQSLDPERKHRAALDFKRSYPHSELLVYIYESELEYARSRNSYQAATAAGEEALKLAP